MDTYYAYRNAQHMKISGFTMGLYGLASRQWKTLSFYHSIIHMQTCMCSMGCKQDHIIDVESMDHSPELDVLFNHFNASQWDENTVTIMDFLVAKIIFTYVSTVLQVRFSDFWSLLFWRPICI